MTNPPARIGALMALGSMLCVQVGLAISVSLIGRVGAEGAAWLRLAWAGVIVACLLLPVSRKLERRREHVTAAVAPTQSAPWLDGQS